MNNSNFLKNAGSRLSNSAGVICCVSATLTGCSLILSSVGIVKNTIAIKSLRDENKKMEDILLRNIQAIHGESEYNANKIIDRIDKVESKIDLNQKSVIDEIAKVKEMIDANHSSIESFLKGENMKLRQSQESLKTEIKKEIDDYQNYVLRQLQISQKIDDDRNNMIMNNHNIVLSQITNVIKGNEYAELEFSKIQNLLLKGKRKMDSIQEITGQNNIEIVKNGVMLEKINENLEGVKAEVKDRLIWISRYLNTLADDYTSVKDKLSWINRNLHTMTDNYTAVKDKLSWINRNLHTMAETDVTRLESLESNFSSLEAATKQIKGSVDELIGNSDQDYQLYQDLIANLSQSNTVLNQDVTNKLRMLEAKLLAQMQQHAKISSNSVKKDLAKIKAEMDKITKMRNSDLSDLSELHKTVKTLKRIVKEYKNQDLIVYMDVLIDLLTPSTSN